MLSAALAKGVEYDYRRFSGCWVGWGSTWEKVADDRVRQVIRRSESQFWFVIDDTGAIWGKGFTSYEVELRAMNWKVQASGTGSSIEAEVSGSSEKITREPYIKGKVTDVNT